MCKSSNGDGAVEPLRNEGAGRVSRTSENDEGIERLILRYLQEHPDAKDTLEGIAQWWVLRSWTELRVAQVETAVSALLANGLLVETRGRGSQPLYGLNEERTTAITEMLEGE